MAKKEKREIIGYMDENASKRCIPCAEDEGGWTPGERLHQDALAEFDHDLFCGLCGRPLGTKACPDCGHPLGLVTFMGAQPEFYACPKCEVARDLDTLEILAKIF